MDGELDGVILLSFEAEEISNYPSVMTMDLPQGYHRLIYHPTEERNNAELTIDDFKDETFIFLSPIEIEDRVNKSVVKILEELGIEPKHIHWVDSVESIFLYVEEGMGVGVAGPSLRMAENDRIRSIPLISEHSLTGLSFCWKSVNANPALTVFIDHIKEKMSELSV